VDDFAVLSDEKRWLQEVKAAVEDSLATLRLKLKPRATRVFPVTEGTDWLGYVIWPTHRRLRPANARGFGRKLRGMQKAYREGKITPQEIKSSILAWIAHASHADTYRLREAIFGPVVFSREET